jgi:hypothetical protein
VVSKSFNRDPANLFILTNHLVFSDVCGCLVAQGLVSRPLPGKCLLPSNLSTSRRLFSLASQSSGLESPFTPA